MQLSAREIAALLNGTIEGDPDAQVSRPGKIEEGGVGVITFLANDKYEEFAYTTTASVLLVNKDFKPKRPIAATLIRVDNVYDSLSFLLEQFSGRSASNTGISEQSFIHPAAKVGERISIGAFTIIEEGAIVGDNCQIGAQVYIGKGVSLGKNVVLHPGVRILHNCQIGDNCVIHPNVVIGSDGFGFALQADGAYKKIPQTGIVIIGNNVEIGAGTTIDRATMGATIIHNGVKLDNLIQIAHNVEIGENTVIAAQTGIAGSTKIGKNCRIGGQVGFVGHLTIADGTQVQAQSGVASSVKEPNSALFGYPALPYMDYIRAYTVFKKLPELYKTLRQLQKKIEDTSSNR